MKITLKIILTLFILLQLNLNLNATIYIMKIQEEKSSIVVTCQAGNHYANAKCNQLQSKIDTCPDGFEDYNATQCKSLITVTRNRLCQSGYVYNSGSQQCQQAVQVGWANGTCGGGYAGCSAIVSPSACYYTCSDGNSFQGFYYERCSSGYADNGRCYSTNYASYTLDSCGTGFISQDTDKCVELKDKTLNICPEGTIELDDNNCY